ncbi:hypothetical protein [Pseudopedobacter beijingensis]|uniref:2TM domain-containing protein n=1 Tax=Pseudopedobacter beijingensis TaxID=1207056 RepID=A0ABW4IJX5_9SPHI
MKTLQRTGLAGAGKGSGAKLNREIEEVKNRVSKRIDKNRIKTNLLYFFSITSIVLWMISLKMLPFGDTLQFLFGAMVLSVNVLIFKYTKI